MSPAPEHMLAGDVDTLTWAAFRTLVFHARHPPPTLEYTKRVPVLRGGGCRWPAAPCISPPRAGTQRKSAPFTLIHAMSQAIKRLWFGHYVEDGSLFRADRKLRIDIVIRVAELLLAQNVGHREGPRREWDLQGPPSHDAPESGQCCCLSYVATFNEACKRAHYTRLEHVSSAARSFFVILTTLFAMTSFGRLCERTTRNLSASWRYTWSEGWTKNAS